jgi:hypothetical protein
VKKNPPILTIICPAITSRGAESGKVFAELQDQVDATEYDVEILVLMDNCKMPIGDKVCKLNHMASGDYIIAIGDDDEPKSDYVEQIGKTITENPGVDVVTFVLEYYANGVFVSNFHYGLGRTCRSPEEPRKKNPNVDRYGHWIKGREPGDIPHSRCAIRREIVQAYHYPPGTWYPEDYIFRDWLADNSMLKTEAHIDKVLYTIRFTSKKRYDCSWKRAQHAKQSKTCYTDPRRPT